jgi:hypothetical protein
MVDILMQHFGMQQYTYAYKTGQHLQVASRLKKIMTMIHKVHGTKSKD